MNLTICLTYGIIAAICFVAAMGILAALDTLDIDRSIVNFVAIVVGVGLFLLIIKNPSLREPIRKMVSRFMNFK